MKLIKLVEIHDLKYFSSEKFPTIERITDIENKLNLIEKELKENRETLLYLKNCQIQKNILMN